MTDEGEVIMSIKNPSVIIKIMVGIVIFAFVGLASYTAGKNVSGASGIGETVTPIFTHQLDNVSGKSLTAIIVDYEPGGRSSAHHHHESASIFAYVLSGAVRSKVNDEEIVVYKEGEFFFEPPGAFHSISENANDNQVARLLAVIIAEDGATITTDDN